MRGKNSLWTGTATLTLAALAALVPNLMAADPTAPAAPAARAVRLSSIDGQVKLTVGSQPATDALANTPLFEGSQLTTADDGRAEIQFEDGSVARLSPNSSLTLSELKMDGATPQTTIQLNSGLAYFEFAGSGKLNIHFSDALVTPTGNSILRINEDTPPGSLAVFSGSAHLERGPTVAVDLHGGECVTLNSGDPTKYDLAETIEPDSWDAWNTDRDQALSAEASASTGAAANLADNAGAPPDQDTNDQLANNQASPDIASNNPAWNDLDANGAWYNVPGEGYIWSPYAASGAGWDPYGCGNWVWTPQFGYVWVSCFNWGYLPYQYGAWSYYPGFGWGWVPGRHFRPWWRGGIWISTVRLGPPGFHMPVRPRGPVGHFNGPLPIVHYNRLNGVATTGLPARSRGTPIAIGGQTVAPLRPITHRPQYGGPVAHSYAQPRAGYVGGGATVWPAHSAGSGSAYGAYGSAGGTAYGSSGGGRVENHPSEPTPGTRSAPSSGGAPHYYNPPPRSAPPASHPSAPSGGGHAAPSSGGGHSSGGGSHR
jgi:hypothetical protein